MPYSNIKMIWFYCLYKDNKSYVGQTTNIKERIWQHKSANKLNGDFEYEILDIYEDLSKKEIKEIEGDWIQIFSNIDGIECINIQTNKKTQETWRLANLDKFKAIQKKSYDKHGLERNKRTKQKCECGGVYVKRNYKLHIKTKKHKNFLELS